MDNKELEKRLKWYEKRYGPYVEKRGLHNYKNLFKKPTTQEWIILFMIIMALFMTLAYRADINNCQNFYEENIVEICKQRLYPDEEASLNILTEDDLKIVESEGG